MKKGVSELITWVLLIGFTISFAIFIGRYMMQSAEKQSEQTIKFVETGLICEKIAMSIENITIQGSNIKDISIKNRGYLAMDGIMIRAYYKRDPPVNKQEEFENLNPNDERAITTSIPINGIEKLEVLPLKGLEGCAISKTVLSCKDIEKKAMLEGFLTC